MAELGSAAFAHELRVEPDADVEKPRVGLKAWNPCGRIHAAEGVQYVVRVDDQEHIASSALLTHVLKIPPGQQTTEHGRRLVNAMKALGWQRPKNDTKITIGSARVRGFFREIEEKRPDPEAE